MNLILGVGNVFSSVRLISNAIINSVSPNMSSIYGAIVLTITGNGFSNNISSITVMIGSNVCPVIQATASQLQCTVPPQGSQSSLVNVVVTSNGITFLGTRSITYSLSVTPTISSVSPTTGSATQVLTISGNNFVTGQTNVLVGSSLCNSTSVSTTSITCILASTAAGSQSVTVYVTTMGKSNANVLFTYILQVTSVSPSQGSYGGGQTIRVIGDGFNAASLSVNVCSRACQSVTVVSNTELLCVTPAATVSVSNTTCNVTVTVDTLSRSASFTYQSSLTTIITSASPTRGGTGGGTTLTINGTNFP